MMSISSINLSTIPMNVPALCIPRAFININEKRVRDTFNALNLGTIERIDIVERKNEKGEKCNSIFVHFKQWYTTEIAKEARERLLTGNEIKIIYDEPWFWKVSALRNIQSIKTKKYEQNRKRRPRSDAIVDEPIKHFPLAKGITRTISAEACGAYDYNRNGELVPYSNKNAAQNFIDTSSYLEPK